MAIRARVLSGIQPTAESFHFGNYLGAVRQWVALQEQYDAFYCVVDLHAVTVEHDPAELSHRTRLAVAQLLAAGLDAQRCNQRFGETFRVPQPYIVRSTAKIADLQDPAAKMSKSASSVAGIVNLLDEPAVSAKKIRSAVTDSGREIAYDPEGKPGVSNMLAILSALSGRDIPELARSYTGRGYGDLKGDLADVVTAFVTPFRRLTQSYLEDSAALDRFLARGAEKARAVARPTLAKAYERVGFLRRSGGTTS